MNFTSAKIQVKLVMCPGRTMTMSTNQRPTCWIGNLQNMVDTPQLLRDPSPGLKIWQNFTTPLAHHTSQMDHWSEKGEYTPPMNYDLLGELVGPWV